MDQPTVRHGVVVLLLHRKARRIFGIDDVDIVERGCCILLFWFSHFQKYPTIVLLKDVFCRKFVSVSRVAALFCIPSVRATPFTIP